MENRDRDKMSKNTGPTPAGDVNRQTSTNQSQQKSGSSTEFGKNIGQSENLNEPNRQSEGGTSSFQGSSRQSESGYQEGSRQSEGGNLGKSRQSESGSSSYEGSSRSQVESESGRSRSGMTENENIETGRRGSRSSGEH